MRKSWGWWLGGLVVLGVGATGAWMAREPLQYAEIATAYGAKQLCSCRFVAGRTEAACLAEFPAEARQQISMATTANGVRASAAFGLIAAEAATTPEGGCTLIR